MTALERYTDPMRPKKSLGQNFLMHAKIAERIAIESGVANDDTALEIGPGTGMLTRPLLARAKKVIAIEADGELIAPLRETFAAEIGSGQLELLHADVREFDLGALPNAYHLVANIPYYITGEIIRTFLSSAKKPRSMTLLVQKEVAERIARSKKGSILSVAVGIYGTPSYLFAVPKGAFRPAPSVDSAVLHIAGIQNPFASLHEETAFFEVLRAGFAHKRKLLAKNLAEIRPEEAIQVAFSSLSIPDAARAEELSVPLWHALAKKLRQDE